MPVEKIVSLGNGVGRDYATLADAFAGPEITNRVADDAFVIVEVYNDDNLAVVGSGAAANGGTATNTVTVKPAYTNDYAANDFLSTPLLFNPALGAALETVSSFGLIINLPANSFVTFEGMQLRCADTNGRIMLSGDSTSIFKDCLINDNGQGDNTASHFENCLIIRDSNTTKPAVSLNYSSANQCTMVVPEDLSHSGSLVAFAGTATANECASFGGATAFSAEQANSDFNASGDATGPGAGSLDNLVFADQFENVNDATQDWRRKAGNSLDGAGLGGIDIGYTIPAAISAPDPNILDVDTDNVLTSDQTNVSINGTVLAGVTSVTLNSGPLQVAQTIIGSPSFSQVLFDVVQGILPFGSLIIEIIAGAFTDSLDVALDPPALNDYVILNSPGNDETTIFYNATTVPQTGDQVEWVILSTNGHVVSISPSGSFTIAGGTGSDSFSLRWREVATDAWGAWTTMLLENAALSAGPVSADTDFNIPISIPVATVLAECVAGLGGALTLDSVAAGANCASAAINGANVDLAPTDNVSGLMVATYVVSEAGVVETANNAINVTIDVINPALPHVMVFNSSSTVNLDVTRPSNGLIDNAQNGVTVV